MSLSDYGFQAAPISMLFILTVLLTAVIAVIALALYFSRGYAYYVLSKKSGFSDSWYGFVPVFQDISCGDIGAGKQKSAIGKLMAVLTVVNFCLLALFVALFGSALVKVVFAADMAMADGLTKLKKTAFEPLRSALAPAIILIATSAINRILKIVSIFKIYLRFAVKGAVILIILGTVIPFLEPVFLFEIRGNSISSKNSGENDAVFDFGA